MNKDSKTTGTRSKFTRSKSIQSNSSTAYRSRVRAMISSGSIKNKKCKKYLKKLVNKEKYLKKSDKFRTQMDFDRVDFERS